MFDIAGKYRIWFGLSGILLLASAGAIAIWGLRPGLDFKGGTLTELQAQQSVAIPEFRAVLSQAGFGEAVIQPLAENKFIVKTGVLDEQSQNRLREALRQAVGEYQELRFEAIGPAISRELVSRAYWQIFLVCAGILLYVAYAFRKISDTAKKMGISSWRLGGTAIVALVHDLIITVGVFAVLGQFRGVEIDSLFVTALLTIVGFSVHDTIVVFDRVRENLMNQKFYELKEVVNRSINATLARSINTSSTLIFVLLGLLLFGGDTVFNFVLALLIGVLIGTYSSIFVASPLLALKRKTPS